MFIYGMIINPFSHKIIFHESFTLQIHLKDKDLQLVKAFSAELQAVRSMFDETNISPPLHANMPPIASRLFWVRALQERIRVSFLYLCVN